MSSQDGEVSIVRDGRRLRFMHKVRLTVIFLSELFICKGAAANFYMCVHLRCWTGASEVNHISGTTTGLEWAHHLTHKSSRSEVIRNAKLLLPSRRLS